MNEEFSKNNISGEVELTTLLGRLLGKVVISGTIECLTGLHIGSQESVLEIGGIDNPVVRDPLTSEPFIPGSSLKGKLRSLLEKSQYKLLGDGRNFFNRSSGKGVYRHECDTAEDASNCPVCSLFGSSGKQHEESKKFPSSFPSPLIVRDCHLTNSEVLKSINSDLLYTEWKVENTLDRVTAASNPRNIERVPRGAIFDLEMVYAVYENRIDHLKNDINTLFSTLSMLELDSLGGSGSRGYGKVRVHLSNVEFKQYLDIGDKKGKIEEIIKSFDLREFQQNSR